MADSTLPHDYYVYALFRRDNGAPFYIGYGRGPRWQSHERQAKSKTGRGQRNLHKIRIIKQQCLDTGLSLPKVIIAENLSADDARSLEIRLIDIIGREPAGPLVNKTAGGDGFVDLSPDALERRRLSQSRRTVPPETREKIAASLRGRKIGPPSEQARENMRRAQRGHKGHQHSIETRGKMSRSRAGRPHSAAQKAAMAAAAKGRILLPETKRKTELCT